MSQKTMKRPKGSVLAFVKNLKKKNTYANKKMKDSKTGPEIRFIDYETVIVPQILGSIASPSLCLIPEGTGESERVGRQVQAKKLHIKGYIKTVTFNYVPAGHFCRIIVYVDQQCNGNAALPGEILDLTGPPTHPINSFNNLEQKDRFLILRDKVVSLSPNNGFYNTTLFTNVPFENYVPFNMNIPLSNMSLQFSGPGGLITDIRSNNIGILIMSTDNTALEARYQARLRYKDN